MKKIILFLIIASVVLVGGFFALNSYIYNEKQVPEPPIIIAENPEGEADPSRMTLMITEWRWIETLYNDERKVTPKKEGQFTLTFSDDGRFSATTDCNSMMGSYTADSSTISFSQIAMTKKFCEGSQESEFASFLTNASGYHFTSRGQLILDLKFDSGSVMFR